MPASRASSSPTMSAPPRPWRASARYSAARRRAARTWRRRPSPADDKLAPLAPRLDPLDRDVGDPRTAGPPAGPGDALLDRPWLTLDPRLHPAVARVPPA